VRVVTHLRLHQLCAAVPLLLLRHSIVGASPSAATAQAAPGPSRLLRLLLVLLLNLLLEVAVAT
jgi:hypothetical protein